MFFGVLDKVSEHHPAGIPIKIAGKAIGQRNFPALASIHQIRQNEPQDRHEIAPLTRDHPAAIGPREFQEFFRHPRDPREFTLNLLCTLPKFALWGLCDKALRLGHRRRNRCAQLMSGIRGEAALCLQGAAQSLQ